MNKYSRPYCPDCKVIYGVSAIGKLLNCTKCGHPLKLKSFNPWWKCMGAAVLIGIGLITILSAQIPIIWFGAFIWAIGLILTSLKQWKKIKELDGPEQLKEDSHRVVINCGGCSHQYHVQKGQGITTTKCPNCGRQARVMT